MSKTKFSREDANVILSYLNVMRNNGLIDEYTHERLAGEIVTHLEEDIKCPVCNSELDITNWIRDVVYGICRSETCPIYRTKFFLNKQELFESLERMKQ